MVAAITDNCNMHNRDIYIVGGGAVAHSPKDQDGHRWSQEGEEIGVRS